MTQRDPVTTQPDTDAPPTPQDDFEDMLAGFDRILNDKALQQELIDAGLLVRTDTAPSDAPREGRPTPEAGCGWYTTCDRPAEHGGGHHFGGLWLAAAGALPSVEDRVRSEISGMRLALSAMDDSATVDNARYRIGRVIESAEREAARLASSKEDRP